jgi:EAL domain-containing protein (putative c-di-GMP-specific phosphodiesterase class I)
MHKMARLKREALEVIGGGGLSSDRATLEGRFANAIEKLWLAYQPIVSVKKRRVFGYEALLRSAEPSLPNPGAFLEAAERLGRIRDLGRAIRERVAEAAATAPDEALLFVNLHSSDLNDEQLYSKDASFTNIARRCVLEITERASLETVKSPIERTRHLRALGFRVAVDDLGAGYAGLTSFAQLEPEIVKLDLALVRGIDGDPRRLSIVRSMKNLCDELGIMVVAEGVETSGERTALEDLGCDLLQGYLFGKPAPLFEPPRL